MLNISCILDGHNYSYDKIKVKEFAGSWFKRYVKIRWCNRCGKSQHYSLWKQSKSHYVNCKELSLFVLLHGKEPDKVIRRLKLLEILK